MPPIDKETITLYAVLATFITALFGSLAPLIGQWKERVHRRKDQELKRIDDAADALIGTLVHFSHTEVKDVIRSCYQAIGTEQRFIEQYAEDRAYDTLIPINSALRAAYYAWELRVWLRLQPSEQGCADRIKARLLTRALHDEISGDIDNIAEEVHSLTRAAQQRVK